MVCPAGTIYTLIFGTCLLLNYCNLVYSTFTIGFVYMASSNSLDYKKDDIQLAKYAKALNHPARVVIIKCLLTTDGCSCGEIVNNLPIAQATVSQHLKILKEAGLIDGIIEPPKIFYHLNQENWAKAKLLFENFMKLSA